jgi:hypothetical protein
MGSLVSDVEKRITQISLAQGKLESMEDKMRDLSGQADIRIDELSGLSRRIDGFFSGKGEPVAIGANVRQKKAAGGGQDRALNEKIFKMHDMGMEIPQIAKIVKLPINDIELRLHIRKD